MTRSGLASVLPRLQGHDWRSSNSVNRDCGGKAYKEGLRRTQPVCASRAHEQTQKETVKQPDRRISPDRSSLPRIARMAMILNHFDWFWMQDLRNREGHSTAYPYENMRNYSI